MTGEAAFDRGETISAFPTLVHECRLDGFDARRDGLVSAVLSARPEGREELDPRGWHTATDLHRSDDAVFRWVSGALTGAIGAMVAHEAWRTPVVALTELWGVVVPPGLAHDAHLHGNSFVSGVLYLDTGPGSGSIRFHDPRSAGNGFAPDGESLAPRITVAPVDGMVLLFPSWLRHSITANQTGRPRVSMAFNALPSGTFGRRTGAAAWTG